MGTTRKCDACGVELKFTKATSTGAIIPLQRIRNVYEIDIRTGEARPNFEPGSTRYINHFETCPKASRFSGRGRRRS